MRLTRLITSFCGAGLLKPAPGTWGTAAALPVGYLLHGFGGAPFLAAAIVVGFFVGIWATQHEEHITKSHDASEIVIDFKESRVVDMSAIEALNKISACCHKMLVFYSGSVICL